MGKAKKSQVSMFIIIGIIIIICSVAFISFTDYDIDIFTDEKSSTKVKEFVESCLELETNRALEGIGNRGGWLYPQGISYAPLELEEKQLLDDPSVKRAVGVDYKFNSNSFEIPYWYYYDSDEEFKDNIPPYNNPDDPDSIQNQMERYIEENIERCFRNFNVFEDVYDVEYDIIEINVDVELPNKESKEIFVSLELPIHIDEITSEGKEYVDFFSFETENVLYIPYLLARDVVAAEDKTAFLEHKIISFMNPYETTDDRDGLPPKYAFKLGYDFDPWSVSDIANEVKRIISSNLFLVKDTNTYYEEIEPPSELESSEFANAVLNRIHTKDYLSQHSILLRDGEKRLFKRFKDYKLDFEYEMSHPMAFKISPSIGNILVLPRPEAFAGIFPIFFTEYVSAYDITTAVFVEIQSEDGDYRFRFPIEVNIDNNNPLRNSYNLSLNFSALTDTSASTLSLTCDPMQFISEPVRINITDPINYGNRKSPRDPLTGVEGAIVEFTCKNLEKCIVLTDTPINGRYPSKNITELEFSLPINCYPGTLEISKFGHKTIRIEKLDPNLNDEINLGEFEMPSSKPLELIIKKKDLGTTKFADGHSLKRDGTETGFLIFENLEEENFVRAIEVNSTNQHYLEIDLMPGNYSITGFVIDNSNTTIPAETIEYDKNAIIPGGKEEVHLPQINLTAWISASLEIERFEVKTKDLLQNEELIVNLIDFGVPKSYDDLEGSSDVVSNTKGLRNFNSIEPYFD